MATPEEDEFQRSRDPVMRRNSKILGGVVLAFVVAAASAVWLAQRHAIPTVSIPLPSIRPPTVALGTPSASVAPQISPTAVPGQPVAGYGFSAADDPTAHEVVVFGGTDSYGTTWLWDGRRWSLAHPATSPPGRFGAAMAYDPSAHTVVLFGGRLGPGEVVNDTWAWNGTTWRKLDSGTGNPPAGEGSAMAWDFSRNEMMLVNSNGGAGGETWLWKGDQWVHLIHGDLPSGTIVSALAVDPITGALLAVQCCGPSQALSAVLRWNGAAWDPVTTSHAPVGAYGLAVDPATNELLLCAPSMTSPRSDTVMWRWTGKDWAAIPGAEPPIVPAAELTDLVVGRLLILGSVVQASQGAPQPIHVWSWDGNHWTQRA
jgi:hypothetical protein